ncbi:MAG TPA: rhomboid family intramembrane serine protease [Thermoanaerobaculia bacterium]|nr:rhomboid family intramembrane serine protease [Thermoanaerobaculia bacterium]
MNGRPRRRTPATKALMIAIVIGFAIEIVTGAWLDGEKLALLGAIVRELIVEHGQWWRLVTAMFLHGDATIGGDFLHLAVNLFSLYQIGRLYELMFGGRRFVGLYFATGIAASLTSMWHNPGPSVGASGAIFGIVGAFISSVLRSPRWRHERGARSIVLQLIGWTVLNFLVLMSFPQIDNAAHMGGLVSGLILGALLPHRVPPPPPSATVIDVQPYEG